MGRSLLSSPAFFVSTSAASQFWFLPWFACISAFPFELRVDVASLELTFGCLIVLCDDYSHSSVCLLLLFLSSCRGSSTEIEISWDRCQRTSIPPNKLIHHLANQSFPTKSWNVAPNRDNLPRENHFLCLHLHAGSHYFLTTLNKLKFADLSGNQFPIDSSVELV